MAASRVQSDSIPFVSLTTIAWTVTLLVSSLFDILWLELTGTQPLWILTAKVVLLVALILLSRPWDQIQPLRPYLIMLLAIALLTKTNSWFLSVPAWMAWQKGQSFTVASITVQLIETAAALLLIAVLFLMGRRRQDSFLIKGDMKALAEPVHWLGQKSPSPLWRFGLVFTLIVIASQFFMFILPIHPSTGVLGKMIPFIPLILLLAASNGFNEEIIFRVSPIAPLYEVVGKSNAIWMAAILFGLAHSIGGIPSGIPGVLITTFLGWFFGKCLVDSKGFFWAWLFHTIQDILPFTLMVLSVLAKGLG